MRSKTCLASKWQVSSTSTKPPRAPVPKSSAGRKHYISTDLDTTLDHIQPDVVFDCAVPEAHHPVTLAALAHGCHVLGEKPLADSLDQRT